MRIRGASGGAQPRCHGGVQAFAMRKLFPPLSPETRLAESQVAVGGNPIVALSCDFFLPGRRRIRYLVLAGILHHFCKDIQIVDIAKQILQAFEVVAPSGIVIRQQAFQRVAKALHPDTQLMPRLGFFRTQCSRVQFLGFLEAFEGQAFRSETARWHKTGAAAKLTLKLFPALDVELCSHAQG